VPNAGSGAMSQQPGGIVHRPITNNLALVEMVFAGVGARPAPESRGVSIGRAGVVQRGETLRHSWEQLLGGDTGPATLTRAAGPPPTPSRPHEGSHGVRSVGYKPVTRENTLRCAFQPRWARDLLTIPTYQIR
jgi:hypothetical protein